MINSYIVYKYYVLTKYYDSKFNIFLLIPLLLLKDYKMEKRSRIYSAGNLNQEVVGTATKKEEVIEVKSGFMVTSKKRDFESK